MFVDVSTEKNTSLYYLNKLSFNREYARTFNSPTLIRDLTIAWISYMFSDLLTFTL